MLTISTELTLPAEAVTETFGILGIRGSGKTTTARVLVEELTGAGSQCVIIDPLGVWWGLRAAADGEHEGLPFTILGGDHGDVAITSTSGEVIAALIVEQPTPVVIDLSLMRKGEQRRFMTAFVDRLYHANRRPLHLVVDECDLYIPQRTIRGTEQLVGAMEDVVRRGRIKGIGVTLISQRPASVHKDVLSQVSILVAHRLLGPHDRKAIDTWVEAHGTAEQRDLMMSRLAGLPTGTAWIWSPAWLNLFAEIPIRAPWTFDSSATPKPGDHTITPEQLAVVDVEALRGRLADVEAEATASDPKLLKARIADLERQLAAQEPEVVTQPVLPLGFYENIDALRLVGKELQEQIDMFGETLDRIETEADKLPSLGSPVALAPIRAPTPKPSDPQIARIMAGRAKPKAVPTHDLSKAESAIVAVLAQHPHGRTRTQLALLTGYSTKSSSLSNALGSLRSAGLVEKGNPIRLTDAGRSVTDDTPSLPTGDALFDHWMARLGKAERAVLEAFRDAAPGHLDRDRLAEITGYSATSSSLSNALGKLRSLDLVDGWSLHPDFATAIR